jgi:hypothetical protein
MPLTSAACEDVEPLTATQHIGLGLPENGLIAFRARSTVSWRDPPTANADIVQKRAAAFAADIPGRSSKRALVT